MAIPDRETLASGLERIGQEAVVRRNDALFYEYFTEDYILHSPAGEFNREAIRGYFAALREGFTDFTISRAQILVDGNFVTARTVMAGRFDKAFAYTPLAAVEPNGQQLEWELINIFRYTDERPPHRGVGPDGHLRLFAPTGGRRQLTRPWRSRSKRSASKRFEDEGALGRRRPLCPRAAKDALSVHESTRDGWMSSSRLPSGSRT